MFLRNRFGFNAAKASRISASLQSRISLLVAAAPRSVNDPADTHRDAERPQRLGQPRGTHQIVDVSLLRDAVERGMVYLDTTAQPSRWQRALRFFSK